MEENKFEKQVQQKMDDLKIHPSDAVWEKIEARIEKRRRPVRGLFLLIFLCVLLTGSYVLWNTSHHPITEARNSEKANPQKNTNEILIKGIKNRKASTDFNGGIINQKNNTAGHGAAKTDINNNSATQYKLSTGKKIIRTDSTEIPAPSAAQHEGKENISADTSFYSRAQPETLTKNEIVKTEKDLSYGEINEDSLSKPPSFPERAEIKDTLQQVPASDRTPKGVNKKKWKPGILFSGGISGIGHNFLGLEKARAYDYPNSAQGSPGTGPGPTPSEIKSAFGFMAGIFAEKDISARAALLLGINFSSFNTSNNVGTRNDTTGAYNSRNIVKSYNNNYSFVEFPVTLKVHLGKGKRLPIFWDGGFVISELISSDGLQFNPVTGYYYSDNSLFNKTQFGLSTSLSLALFSKQKNKLLIGPYFYYSASGVASEGLYNKKHFVFSGLRTEFIIGK